MQEAPQFRLGNSKSSLVRLADFYGIELAGELFFEILLTLPSSAPSSTSRHCRFSISCSSRSEFVFIFLILFFTPPFSIDRRRWSTNKPQPANGSPAKNGVRSSSSNRTPSSRYPLPNSQSSRNSESHHF
ncbi:hypothetical protein BVRB_014040 [Beta vulgaris subsp. vulgaris]|uniref:Uncharacterized protein n=1 Tax=Beta vulgaris subsp. vulgaris TaxID=3555 RepID=A0A0J8B4X9_BETVV|nr:hypothetical protein BVRB_014040 [Beta vulgaris subsp. vulgaris]